MEENTKIKDIIELVYQSEEKILDEKIRQVNRKVKNRIKDIDIEEVLKDTLKPNELSKILETLEENYSIKITEYNKEFYKQGFADGVNLIINCLKI